MLMHHQRKDAAGANVSEEHQSHNQSEVKRRNCSGQNPFLATAEASTGLREKRLDGGGQAVYGNEGISCDEKLVDERQVRNLWQ